MDLSDATLEALGAAWCEKIRASLPPWDWCLSPHHRGWKRAWAEVRQNCDQGGLSWQVMESSAQGHHFRQRTSDGGKNRWYTVALREDDFEPVEPER